MPELLDSAQAVLLMDHQCGDENCSQINILLKNSSMTEINGELVPCVTLTPEAAFDLLSLLSQSLKRRIIIIEGED
jgi:hypothetical protein